MCWCCSRILIMVINGLTWWINSGEKLSYIGSGTAIKSIQSSVASSALINGVAYASGEMTLDGVNDYIDNGFGGISPGTGDFSYGMWINPSVTPSGTQVPLSVYPGGGNGNTFLIFYLTSGKVYGFIRDGAGNSATATSTSTIALNVWTYILCTRTGGTLKIYINGALEATTTGSTSNISLPTAPFRIGQQNSLSFYAGKFRDAHLYIGKCLTANEALENYYNPHTNIMF